MTMSWATLVRVSIVTNLVPELVLRFSGLFERTRDLTMWWRRPIPTGQMRKQLLPQLQDLCVCPNVVPTECKWRRRTRGK